MRVYLVYLKDGLMDGRDYFYGYTENINDFEMFKDTRCNKAFNYRMVKMSKEEYKNICVKYPDNFIELFPLYTRYVNSDGLISIKDVKMPLTSIEYNHVSIYKLNVIHDLLEELISNEDFDLLNNVVKHNMKPKIKRILNSQFKFSDIIQLYTTPIDEINEDEYTIDELALFIKLYKFTLIEESSERRRMHFESLENL